MVEEGRHSNHEAKEVLRLLGHDCKVDVSNYERDEKLYWLGTESGLLGSFGFEGSCTAGDVSCDPPTKSMGTGFCNFNTM